MTCAPPRLDSPLRCAAEVGQASGRDRSLPPRLDTRLPDSPTNLFCAYVRLPVCSKPQNSMSSKRRLRLDVAAVTRFVIAALGWKRCVFCGEWRSPKEMKMLDTMVCRGEDAVPERQPLCVSCSDALLLPMSTAHKTEMDSHVSRTPPSTPIATPRDGGSTPAADT